MRRKILGSTFRVYRRLMSKERRILTVKVDEKFASTGKYRIRVFNEEGDQVFSICDTYHSLRNYWLNWEIADDFVRPPSLLERVLKHFEESEYHLELGLRWGWDKGRYLFQYKNNEFRILGRFNKDKLVSLETVASLFKDLGVMD